MKLAVSDAAPVHYLVLIGAIDIQSKRTAPNLEESKPPSL